MLQSNLMTFLAEKKYVRFFFSFWLVLFPSQCSSIKHRGSIQRTHFRTTHAQCSYDVINSYRLPHLPVLVMFMTRCAVDGLDAWASALRCDAYRVASQLQITATLGDD